MAGLLVTGLGGPGARRLLAQSPAQPPAASNETAPAKSAPAKSEPGPVHRPLEGLAGQHILVLPVQYIVFGDTLGWSMQAPPARTYLETLDDEITFALKERGLETNWILSDAVTHSAQRNAGFAADPHALQATEIRMGVKNKEFQLKEPLASQLRSLIALNDARYVLFPVEVRTRSIGQYGQASLHLVLLDARRSQVQWSADVQGEPMRQFSPAVAADLASRMADLIAPAN